MDNDQRAQVGARIIAARGSQGLSQEELSSRAGITANTLRRIERGDKVHAGNLSAVCQALGITTGGFTADIEIVRDMVGEYLQGLPPLQRAEARKAITRLVMGGANSVADYIAIPKTVTDGTVDDPELKEALGAARAKLAEAEGTIPVEGAKVMGEALKPFRERCAELGATAAASVAAVSPSVSPPQAIDWSSSTVSPFTPPAPPVPAGMVRVVMEVDTPDGRATMADLTVGEGGKISQHEGVDVPLTMKSDGRRGLALVRPIGEFVQLTAQNRMDSGSISCRILASDGSVISENVSSGGYVVVGCQGRAR